MQIKDENGRRIILAQEQANQGENRNKPRSVSVY